MQSRPTCFVWLQFCCKCFFLMCIKMKPRFSPSLLIIEWIHFPFFWISSPWRLILVGGYILLFNGYLYLQFLDCKKSWKNKLLKWEVSHFRLLELWHCTPIRQCAVTALSECKTIIAASGKLFTVKAGQAYPLDWKMNPLVDPATNVKFKSAFLHASWAVNLLREPLCIWSDWKSLNGLNFIKDIYIKLRETELVEIS